MSLYALQVLQYCFISYVYECMWFLTVGLLRHFIVFLQAHYASETMPKKGKKKAKVADDESYVEITTRVEIIYKDTKYFTMVNP